MNPWIIYWVLQADDIQCAFGVGAAVCAGVCAIYAFVGALLAPTADTCPKDLLKAKSCLRNAKIAAIPAILLGVLFSLAPSTRTAATMVILPAIANNEAIRDEATELYDLAKDALRNAAGIEAQPE